MAIPTVVSIRTSPGLKPPGRRSTLQIMAENLVGKKVGKYEVVRLLGKGGMGEVYQVKHEMLGREVAIKVLYRTLSDDEEVAARFRQEAKAVNRIGHDSIVQVTDFDFLPDGRSYFVMELLRGESLRDILAREKRLSTSQAHAVLAPIMGALAAAHKAGIIHRDIKPDNVFLHITPGGQTVPKLLDFGIAKLLDPTPGSLGVATQTGALLGTPTYMSPEQVGGEIGDIGPWSDVYSAAAVLFHTVAGRPPFEGPSFGALLIHHMQSPPPSLLEVVPDAPPELDAMIKKAMAKKPEDRYRTMQDFLDAFDAACGDNSSPLTTQPLPKPVQGGVGLQATLRAAAAIPDAAGKEGSITAPPPEEATGPGAAPRKPAAHAAAETTQPQPAKTPADESADAPGMTAQYPMPTVPPGQPRKDVDPAPEPEPAEPVSLEPEPAETKPVAEPADDEEPEPVEPVSMEPEPAETKPVAEPAEDEEAEPELHVPSTTRTTVFWGILGILIIGGVIFGYYRFLKHPASSSGGKKDTNNKTAAVTATPDASTPTETVSAQPDGGVASREGRPRLVVAATPRTPPARPDRTGRRHGRAGGTGTPGTPPARVPGQNRPPPRVPPTGKRTAVRVSIGGISVVTGRASGVDVRNGLKKNRSRLKACYVKKGAAQKNLSGTVKVHFIISPDGLTLPAETRSSTLNHAPTENCVLNVLNTIRFPKPVGGGSSVVSATIRFRLKDKPKSKRKGAGAAAGAAAGE